MLAEDKPVDVFTLCDHTGLDREYISGVHKTTACSANVHAYAEVVKREARRENIRLTLKNGLSNIEDKDPGSVAADCMAGLQEAGAKAKDLTLAEAIHNAFEKSRETQRRVENGQLAGISTTLSTLDELTGGLRGPRMIVLGGRPGTYKTAYAWQIVLGAALNGAPCGFVSLEMGADELGERAIATLLKVDGHQFSSGDVGAYQNAKRKCSGGIKDLPVWIDDGTQDWNLIEGRIVEWKFRHNIQLAVIDYMQIIRHEGRNRFESLSDISRRTKLLAKRLDMPILILSQISREVEKEERKPIMSDLRECGNIEQDADIIMFTHRKTGEDQSKDTFQLILAKHRGGPARRAIDLEINGRYFRVSQQ